eukprot:2400889-Amphidinium_carterae.1
MKEWVEQNPKAVYVPMSQDLPTAIKNFPVLRIQQTRGVKGFVTASSAQEEDINMSPHAMAVQELQALPQDVDTHFSELAKAFFMQTVGHYLEKIDVGSGLRVFLTHLISMHVSMELHMHWDDPACM